jgi:uncharacterized membrane protein YoaK (UPF0700 family)
LTHHIYFPYILIGGFLLALNAGYTGSLFWSQIQAVTVAHMSGNAIRAGVELSRGGYSEFGQLVGVICFFTLGSAVSGVLVGGRSFNLRSYYAIALLLESVLLLISYLNIKPSGGIGWSDYMGAMAMGVQNAVCTSYSGAVIRTTHVTGSVTDIGVVIGVEVRKILKPYILQLLRPKQASVLDPDGSIRTENLGGGSSWWKLKVLVPLVIGYISGGCLGGLVHGYIGNEAMLVPMGFTLLLSLLYGLRSQLLRIWNNLSTHDASNINIGSSHVLTPR